MALLLLGFTTGFAVLKSNMVLGLFKRHCPVCGKEVDKEKAVKRFGKHLCSEEHAEEYRQKMVKQQSKAAKRGGCCG